MTENVTSPENQDLLFPNGVDGTTGEYLPAPTPRQVTDHALDEPLPELRQRRALEAWHKHISREYLGPKEGVDPKNLASAGWGVLFAHDADPAVRDALAELLEHRRHQATQHRERYYQDYSGPRGYRPGMSKEDFLLRHGMSAGDPADPEKVPYYLLLVGGPTEIPFRFQYQLDIEYAVGRIHFERPEDYECYARSVVRAETEGTELPRKAVFFGPRHPDDRATQLSHDHLVRPLAAAMAADQTDWDVEAVLGAGATKARLRQLLGGPETPALLMTAGHGMSFPRGHRRQATHQGGLICQDWPGHGKKISQELYVVADDIGDEARPGGLVAFHFACYSAGTPELDSFTEHPSRPRRPRAPRAFVARLPRRLLGHPRGGALAIVGHVDRTWGSSFTRSGAEQIQAFESTFKRLLEGHPVGSAMEYFNQRHTARACALTEELEQILAYGKVPDERHVSRLWRRLNDARNFVVLGDPAVRLAAAPEPGGEA